MASHRQTKDGKNMSKREDLVEKKTYTVERKRQRESEREKERERERERERETERE